MKRCQWAMGSALEKHYHDEEWGVPLHDDRRLFEFLVLEGAQAGLSWSTILNKREGYRQAFDNFDPKKVARYSQNKIDALLSNRAIIRNRLKIHSAVTNANAFLEVQAGFGSFDSYIWRFVNDTPIRNRWKKMTQIPAVTAESTAMSKDLKKKGFRFVGPTICYAFMQAVGMVNDHTIDCFRYGQINRIKSSPRPLSQLINIGPKIEKRLNEIRVFNEKDLAALGPVEAYRQIRKNHPQETLPVCYYLYSFEGALNDLHWNDIGQRRKNQLKKQIR